MKMAQLVSMLFLCLLLGLTVAWPVRPAWVLLENEVQEAPENSEVSKGHCE